jgi:Xaa-Pro dipeptidase
MSAFGLNFCHGLGLGLHERPLVAGELLQGSYELGPGWCSRSRRSVHEGRRPRRGSRRKWFDAAGAKIITLFPARTLPIANKY